MHKQTIIDFKELGLRQLFTKPLKELKTRDLDQVETLLREVEAYQEAGFYAVGYVSYEAAPAFEKKLAVHPAPLMGEYLLYFTIHEKVETLPFPEDYEAVDPSSQLAGRGRGACLSKSHRDHPAPHPPRGYLSGQLHCPAFSRAKS